MSYLPIRHQPPFSLDVDAIRARGDELSAAYQAADPFPHTVIEDFLPRGVVDYCQQNFPGEIREGGNQFDRDQERFKRSFRPDELDDLKLRSLFHTFNSLPFLQLVERITGIKGLIPDPYFLGGGFHETRQGGHLSMHADFNHHKPLGLERRVNVLIYLNDDWDESYGGNLELWDEKMKECRQRIAPVASRCVIFSTTGNSWHGHPEPVAHPDLKPRRSIALYYYTATWQDDQIEKTTQFKVRKGTNDRVDWKVRTNETLEQILPPILMRPTRKVLSKVFR
ncbi:2OG-Fe(II) oxygenase [Parvularcula sp. ZS-1/3]|uniref:2OG-Fe(II) oxygenase n=1 Tax=Parvularcula mediterranea TaxID=2732508 RepID=A0A7Y3RLQ9_9PROT|nr:2OG-Fe(II) oxygenase [Parvularcula mediterranea]NNU16339.1 2OG-Fe(II) oxygenase [Parvularcula mediterranea]